MAMSICDGGRDDLLQALQDTVSELLLDLKKMNADLTKTKSFLNQTASDLEDVRMKNRAITVELKEVKGCGSEEIEIV